MTLLRGLEAFAELEMQVGGMGQTPGPAWGALSLVLPAPGRPFPELLPAHTCVSFIPWAAESRVQGPG